VSVATEIYTAEELAKSKLTGKSPACKEHGIRQCRACLMGEGELSTRDVSQRSVQTIAPPADRPAHKLKAKRERTEFPECPGCGARYKAAITEFCGVCGVDVSLDRKKARKILSAEPKRGERVW
jgi:hypothetical protein